MSRRASKRTHKEERTGLEFCACPTTGTPLPAKGPLYGDPTGSLYTEGTYTEEDGGEERERETRDEREIRDERAESESVRASRSY